MSNAFSRIFYEPKSNPPRLSWARMVGFWLSIPGTIVASVAVWQTPIDLTRLLAGAGMVVLGVTLYGFTEWKRIRGGEFEVERRDE